MFKNLFTKTRFYLFTIQMQTILPDKSMGITYQTMTLRCKNGFFTAQELRNYCIHHFGKYFPEIEAKAPNILFMMEINKKQYEIYNQKDK